MLLASLLLVVLISFNRPVASVPLSDCNYVGEQLPASVCNQYYLCQKRRILLVKAGFEQVLKTCPYGSKFDVGLRKCSYFVPLNDDCILRTTTEKTGSSAGRTPASDPPAFCRYDGERLVSSVSCRHYFRCEAITNYGTPIGFNQYLVTCPYGLSFDAKTRTCEKKALIHGQFCLPKLRGPNTKTPTQTSMRCDQWNNCEPIKPALPPPRPGGYSQSATGQGYMASYNQGGHRLTQGEIARTVVTPAPTADQCTTAGLKFPGPEENQYWECLYIWQKYVLKLESCRFKQIFNYEQQKCVLPD